MPPWTPTTSRCDVGRVAQERADLDRHRPVADEEIADRQAEIGRLQRLMQIGHRDPGAGEARRIDLDPHGAAWAAERRDLARPGDALELGLDAVGDALEVVGARGRVLRVHRQRDDRHVVDALGFDQRRADAEAARQPVGIRVDRVVEADQRFGAWHADLELHREHRHAGPRERHHVLDAGDLRQHLLGRRRHHLLDVAHRGARERDQHVGHRHVDLRLFLARRHQHRERAEQQREQREQRRDLGRLEEGGDAAGDAQLRLHGADRPGFAPPCRACGSSATRSPAPTPASTSTWPPSRAAEPHLAQSGPAVGIDHVEGREFGAPDDRLRRDVEPSVAAIGRREPGPREHPRRHAVQPGRQGEAKLDGVRRRVGCRQDLRLDRLEPLALGRHARQLDPCWSIAGKPGGSALWHADADAQGGRVVEGQQRAARQRHVAEDDRDIGDEGVVGRPDDIEARRGAGRPGAGELGRDLGLRGLELGLGALERCPADVVLRVQLLLALEFLRRRLLRGARRLDLGRARGRSLLGGARVEPEQHLAGLHRVAGLDIERDHGARYLGGDDRLSNRLDDAVIGGVLAAASAAHHRARQPAGLARRDRGENTGEDQHA